MKVLILCNNAFVKGNGLCTAVQSLMTRLRKEGVDARLMAAVNADADGSQPDFPLEHFKFPLFEPIIYANGFRYAKTDRKRIRAAIEWADVVHVQEAFPLEITAINIARKLGRSVVGTFHLFPENVTANLNIGHWTFVSNLILSAWRDWVFNKCSHIHCPTEFVLNHLKTRGFKPELRTISNGIEIHPTPKAISEDIDRFKVTPYKILSIGRLSSEKDQFTLLKAMSYSRHAGEIELHFAGNGPFLKKYQKIADKLVRDGILSIPPKFGFYGKDELAKLAAEAYLYIHTAWVEVEGLSCLEALREGIVPVIAQGALSATSQFALDEHSTFPVFNAKALAEKIDWWIEHPEERAKMGPLYAESTRKYDQEASTKELIRMYEDAIESTKTSH